MGDFKETGLRCRVHPPIGKPVPCLFDEAQKEAVLAAMTRYVRLVGEATEAEGEILSLKIADIEVLDCDVDAEERGKREPSSSMARQTWKCLQHNKGSQWSVTSPTCWAIFGLRTRALTSSLPPYANGVMKGSRRATADGRRRRGQKSLSAAQRKQWFRRRLPNCPKVSGPTS